jgi:polyphosphate kinase
MQIKNELGAKHPIALMVEMTTRFDEATAVRVINKLEEIMANV